MANVLELVGHGGVIRLELDRDTGLGSCSLVRPHARVPLGSAPIQPIVENLCRQIAPEAPARAPGAVAPVLALRAPASVLYRADHPPHLVLFWLSGRQLLALIQLTAAQRRAWREGLVAAALAVLDDAPPA